METEEEGREEKQIKIIWTQSHIDSKLQSFLTVTSILHSAYLLPFTISIFKKKTGFKEGRFLFMLHVIYENDIHKFIGF